MTRVLFTRPASTARMTDLPSIRSFLRSLLIHSRHYLCSHHHLLRSRSRLLFLFVLVSMAWSGCEQEEKWSAPYDPVVCGMEPYSWLDPAGMGNVVFHEQDTLFSMSRNAIQALLNTTDYAEIIQVKYGVNVYQVRYETQDRGVRREATMVFGIPDPADTIVEGEDDGSHLESPYVLWLHGTTGFMDDCAPSAGGSDAALPAVLMASQGYIGVAPDYLGLAGFGEPSGIFHPYLVGEATAIASWDAIRAAGKVIDVLALSAPVRPDDRVIIWGGSQGGHAAFFAERYAPHYAWRYDVTGTVALIPPTDLLRQTESALTTFGSATALLAATFVEMSRWYGHQDLLAEALTNDPPSSLADTLPTLMDSTCSISSEDLQVTQVSDIFRTELIQQATMGDWESFEIWRCMLAENTVATTSVPRSSDTPILMVLGELDELVDTEVERQSFDTLCDQGYRLEYIECIGASHTQAAAWTISEQFTWVSDRLAGRSLENPCQRPAAVCCSGTDEGPCVTPP